MGWLGIEADIAHFPQFFAEESDFLPNAGLLTAMGNVRIGVPIGMGMSGMAEGAIPYVSAGLGVIRPNIRESGGLATFSEARFGWNAGGGIGAYFSDHVGLEGDIRYFRRTKDDDAAPNAFGIDLRCVRFLARQPRAVVQMVSGGRLILLALSIGVMTLVAFVGGRHRTAGDAAGSWHGKSAGSTTSREGLRETVARLSARFDADPRDTAAAVGLADALLRQSGVLADAQLAARAEQVLRRAAAADATSYEVKRMTATVLLAQHRFREAIAAAGTTRALRPYDAWNDGVIGDAHLELGEYEEAFDAFDRMMDRRPSAAAYARVSYARELQGHLDAAADLMAMALEATPPSDPEAQAWHASQLGHLEFERGRLDEAVRHFRRALFVFPDYPLAGLGVVQVLAAKEAYAEALAEARRQFRLSPSADLAALLGDLSRELGYSDAEEHYKAAERLWSTEPAALARFLADRERDVPRAVQTATRAVTLRRDIFTEDALAWALHKAGRSHEALAAAERALRTGARDRHILAHAAAIHAAAGGGRRAECSRQPGARESVIGTRHPCRFAPRTRTRNRRRTSSMNRIAVAWLHMWSTLSARSRVQSSMAGNCAEAMVR